MPKLKGQAAKMQKGEMGQAAKRLLKSLFHYYKWEMGLVFVCLLFSAVGGTMGSIFIGSNQSR